MSIVPVKVKARGKGKIIETYALLDSGSTATFCDVELMKNLNEEGQNCQISLETIDGYKEDFRSSLVSLEAMDLDEKIKVHLSNVFSVQRLNVSKDGMATQGDVDRLAYMQGVELPRSIDHGKVSLWNGVDVAEALEPVEMRRSLNGGSYAVKTKFGWTLNGPLDYSNRRAYCMFVNTISPSDEYLCSQLKSYFNQDFRVSIADDTKKLSVQDKHALKTFEESVQLVNGHYQIAIPWKEGQPCMPNNRQVAEKRLGYLQRRLLQE